MGLAVEGGGMDIDNSGKKEIGNVFFTENGFRECCVLEQLFGIRIPYDLIYVLEFLMDDKVPYSHIIERAIYQSEWKYARAIFLAAFEYDRGKIDHLFRTLHCHLENPVVTQHIGVGALLGLALAIFEIGVLMDSSVVFTDSLYEETIVPLIFSLIKLKVGSDPIKLVNFTQAMMKDKVFCDRLSRAIKNYFRAESNAHKRGSRLAQAQKIAGDIVEILEGLPRRQPTTPLGDYIVSQITFAIFSPLSVFGQIKAVSLILNDVAAIPENP